MKTLINTSQIRDYSTDSPTVIYSNPVTTVLHGYPPTPCCCRPTQCCCCDSCCCDRCHRCDCCCDNND